MPILIFTKLEHIHDDHCKSDEINQLVKISSPNNQTKMLPITSKNAQKRKVEIKIQIFIQYNYLEDTGTNILHSGRQLIW